MSSIEENKALVRRYVEEILNKKNYSALGQFIDAKYVQHMTVGDSNGIEGMLQFYNKFFTAFPDMYTTNEDMITEGDYVVSRQTLTGTHQGEFMGIPPAGKSVNIQQITINRIFDGKFVESWGIADMLGMMQQLRGAPSQ